MEGVELVLDVLGTGAVLAGAEVQKDIDLGKTHREGRELRGGGGAQEQEQQPASGRVKTERERWEKQKPQTPVSARPHAFSTQDGNSAEVPDGQNLLGEICLQKVVFYASILLPYKKKRGGA